MSKKILIAEDETPMANALRLKLEHSGYEVSIAGDGEEAVRLLSDGHFDLALLDLVMPKKDGFSVLAFLQESKEITTPAIVASNLGQTEDRGRAESLGAIDYFVKSDISLADILDKVNNFFSRS
ncbi:MAG: response regulator [Candidatus Moranbacteria bacterium]|nr:response regulator [Candidatus Moranbacteria bacterium]